MLHIHTIGIIGHGDFGKFLQALATTHFPDVAVQVSSSRFAPDGTTFFSLEEVCRTDILILAVPISAFTEVVAQITPLLGPETTVCDVATVKKYTVDILKSQQVPRFLATHPMFGPYSYEKRGKSLEGLRLAVCDTNISTDEYAEIIVFFRKIGLCVLAMTSDEHDKLIAETLFLTHLVGQIVKKGKFERTSIDTISFGFLMDAVESVAHDEALFRDVFRYNPYCAEVLKRFEEGENQVKNSLS